MAGIDNTLSSLARKLEPYIIAAVRRVIGNSGTSADALADTGYTTIMSHKYYKDSPDGAHGAGAVDLGQYYTGVYESSARATLSTALGGYNSIVYSGSDYSLVNGYYNGVYATRGGKHNAILASCFSRVVNVAGRAFVIGNYARQTNNN